MTPILRNLQDRMAWMLAGAICAACSGQVLATVHSDVVTASKIEVPAASALVSFSVHPNPTFVGKVASVSGNVITIDGSLTPGALNAADPGDGIFLAQYVVKLRHDRTGDGKRNQGDWFKVVSNTGSTVTVDPIDLDGPTLSAAASIGAGDIVQIEKLATLADTFGTGLSLNPGFTKTSNLDDVGGDALYFPGDLGLGLSFAKTLFYHDGTTIEGNPFPQGWYADGVLVDASLYTLAPDQALFSFNNYGPGYDVTRSGSVQCFSLSHLIFPGANSISHGFAAPAPVGTSGLYLPPLPGQTFQASGNLDDSLDAVYLFAGLSVNNILIYHNGATIEGNLFDEGWYADGVLDPLFPLPPTSVVVKSVQLPYIWRQPKP